MRNWLATTLKKDPLVFCVWALAFALLIGFGVSLFLLGHAKLFGGMSVSSAEVLRDIALTVAAILGFPLFLQRTRAAIKQADIDSSRLLADRYARAAELFASGELSARLAGLYALWDLARDEAKIYHVRIMGILCTYVRSPLPYKGFEDFPGKRPDVATILELIGSTRNLQQIKYEIDSGYWLNFRGADLRGAYFHDADLSRTHFVFADLRDSTLASVKFDGVTSFYYAVLNRVSLHDVLDMPEKLGEGVIIKDDCPDASLPYQIASGPGFDKAIAGIKHLTWEEWKEKKRESRI